MRFKFATAGQILFGAGILNQTGDTASQMGSHALVVVGRSPERARGLLSLLKSQGLSLETFSVPEEPTIELVGQGVGAARDSKCDLVISFGGGSVIDAGKAIAALLTNPGDVLDFLEVIGKGQPLVNPPVPFIAIPTTAGTGSEVTRNAVLASPKHKVKVSLRSRWMLPDLAVIDPSLTLSLPPAITASTGMDALTQCIEPFVSPFANPLTDAVCREGIRRAARSLQTAYDQGKDIRAREDMALVSLFGGLALANSKLGAVHGFAGPLGGMLPKAAHGAICGRLLPFVMGANLKALRDREPANPALTRYTELAQILTGDPTASAPDGVSWVRECCARLDIEPLRNVGLGEADFEAVVDKARQASSMKGNPITLTNREMHDALQEAL